MSATPETTEVLAIAERIKPHLAGRSPEIQGAVLAELLSVFIAGHYKGGSDLMDRVLNMHVEMVRQLVPSSIEALKLRGQGGTPPAPAVES
jgi:hypothetical protein